MVNPCCLKKILIQYILFYMCAAINDHLPIFEVVSQNVTMSHSVCNHLEIN